VWGSEGAAVGGYDELIDRLEAVAADLDEIAFDRLREAVADGETARPANDRQLMQARRAIEKAVAVLRRLDGADDQST
jgi:hypothetical protein